ncbi:hypothetical protein M9H77_17957 [Catharanthus roseus]|uniref:Uncharacterized protein n=1 Tax=Catharanthus roseus TaxID=4058 RepID=A0ACC0B632_CATRO|nr:hypothetical protein M9H77_17957 [Catharanthus roseus]
MTGKKKILSHAGKEILIKNVVQAIHTYVMSCLILPTNIIHSLNSMGNKKMYWKAWSKLYFEGFNFALITKQCWRTIKSPSSLMATCLQEKYYSTRNFQCSLLGSRPSFFMHRIDNGLSTNISHGKRIPTLRKLTHSPSAYLGDRKKKLS